MNRMLLAAFCLVCLASLLSCIKTDALPSNPFPVTATRSGSYLLSGTLTDQQSPAESYPLNSNNAFYTNDPDRRLLTLYSNNGPDTLKLIVPYFGNTITLAPHCHLQLKAGCFWPFMSPLAERSLPC